MPKKTLNELFESNPGTKPIQSTNMRKPPSGDLTYTIYPLSKFNELQEAVKTINAAKANCFRYIVDTSGKLWLAAEGIANRTIPAHFQLTSMPQGSANCLTAGNFKFKENKLISINHKSGDFQPPFSSLFHVLVILANTANLPFEISDLLIEQLTSSNGPKDQFEIEANDLMSWGKQYSDSVREQPQETKQVTYQNMPSRFFRENSPPAYAGASASGLFSVSPVRSLCLFDDDDDDETPSPSKRRRTDPALPETEGTSPVLMRGLF